MKKALCVLAILVAFATVSAIDFSTWKSIVSGGPAARVLKVNPSFTQIWWNGFPLNAVTGFSDGKSYILQDQDWDKSGNLWIVGNDSGLTRYGTDGSKKVFQTKDGLASNVTNRVLYDAAGNRLIVSSLLGVSVTTLDANNDPTGWVNALSVSIHQVLVGATGDIWAINSTKVYHFENGSWKEYAQFGTPTSGALDVNGNFWLSFGRQQGLMMECGLAMFDGQNWTEHLSPSGTFSATPLEYGKIVIDRHNLLWFSGYDGIGTVDLSTFAEERIPKGTLAWAPINPASPVNLIKTPEGEVMYSGQGKILWKSAESSVRNPLVAVRLEQSSSPVFGTFNLLGRSIVNSFYNVHSSGVVASVRTSRTLALKSVVVR